MAFDIPSCECIGTSRNDEDGKPSALQVQSHFFLSMSSFVLDRAWVPCNAIHEDSEIKELGDTGTLLVDDHFASIQKWF